MDIITPLLRPIAQAIFGWLPGAYRWLSVRFGRWVPLPLAARIAYEQARLSRSIWALAAERLGTDPSPEGVLDWVATYIAQDSNIWGKRPPSTKTELIAPMQSKYGNFSGGATTLRLRDESHSVFTDLRIERKGSAARSRGVPGKFEDRRSRCEAWLMHLITPRHDDDSRPRRGAVSWRRATEEDTMKLMRSDRLDAIIAAALYSGIITAAVSYFEYESFFQKYQEEESQVITRMAMSANHVSQSNLLCLQELAQSKRSR